MIPSGATTTNSTSITPSTSKFTSDEIVTVSNDESFATARTLAKLEGIPAGISSGAALAATAKIARRPELAGKMIVTIIPSFAERYLSTVLFDGLGS